MKKQLIGIFLATFFCSMVFSGTAFAAGFVQDEGGVKYQNDDGTFSLNTFIQIEDSIYHLDENGFVQFGWIQVGDLWYFMDNTGVCVNPWGEVNPPAEQPAPAEEPVKNEAVETRPSSEWVPYSTSDLNTLANAMAKGYVIFDGTQYWATREYVDMLSNENIVYLNDLAPAPLVDRFKTAELRASDFFD